ncbi:MAG: sulfite exporter TauE/SafE family protein [Geminicoccaceae bacterium]
MTIEVILFIIAGAVCGGFVNGLAGFGTSLFALGWWLQVLPPLQAVALSFVMSVLGSIPGIVLVWRYITWRRLARFLIPALLGIPVGLAVLHRIDAASLTIALAAFLLLYGGFFSFRRGLPTIVRPTPIIDLMVGFLGGVCGAIAGLSGVLPTIWCSLRAWPKAEQRAVLQPYNVIILSLSALSLALDGNYDRNVLLTIVAALPATLISALIGIQVFKRLNDAQFRRLLIILMLVSGLSLLIRIAW